jgi:simple sugar transport system substrate-binding protein
MRVSKLKPRRVTSRSVLLSIMAAATIVVSTLAVQHGTGVLGEPAGADHAVPQPDDAQVRIAARAVGDGRVEVALQVMALGEQWDEQHLPAARFISSDDEPGRWRYSSKIAVPTHWPYPTSIEEQHELVLHGTEDLFSSRALMCFIGHQDPTIDLFWNWTAGSAFFAAFEQRQRMRAFYSADGAAQAEAIRQCVADGADGIAATLANFDAVGGALRHASEAGVNVLTYNSGRGRSREVGAFAHLSLDDAQGGRLVAERLNQAGVEGEVWCLIHEPVNTGLDERCDGLEAAYAGGAVQRVRVHSPELRRDAAATLGDAEPSAVIALNVDTTLWALETARQAGRDDLYFAGFGADERILLGLLTEQIRFIVWDQPIMQGALAVQALQMMDYTHSGTGLEFGGAHILIEPALIAKEQVLAWFASLPPELREGLLLQAGLTPEQIEAVGLGN